MIWFLPWNGFTKFCGLLPMIIRRYLGFHNGIKNRRVNTVCRDSRRPPVLSQVVLLTLHKSQSSFRVAS